MFRSLALVVCVLCAVPCAAQSLTPEDVVSRQRAAYGERVTPAQAPDLLHAIAEDLTATFGTRYGRLVKTSGNNCGGFACDIICDANKDHFDVFQDGPDASVNYAGVASPAWNSKGFIGDRTCQLVDAAATVPTPTPSPTPSVDLTPLLQRLDALESRVSELQQRLQDEQDARVRELRTALQLYDARVTTLEGRKLITSCKASASLGAFRIPIHCEVQ
jgi:hypothetical protein